MHAFTQHALLTALHGMFFGGFFLLAAYGLCVGVALATRNPSTMRVVDAVSLRAEKAYLLAAVAFAWLAVLSGTFLVYPWYRAAPPSDNADLHAFPRQLLLSSPLTAPWHSLGMEWKEHVAFLAPIAVTAVAYICVSHREVLLRDRQVRTAVFCFLAVALGVTGIAGVLGALLNKLAPVL